jgi:hypothetical protein
VVLGSTCIGVWASGITAAAAGLVEQSLGFWKCIPVTATRLGEQSLHAAGVPESELSSMAL